MARLNSYGYEPRRAHSEAAGQNMESIFKFGIVFTIATMAAGIAQSGLVCWAILAGVYIGFPLFTWAVRKLSK